MNRIRICVTVSLLVLSLCEAAAQGHLRWPRADTEPVALVLAAEPGKWDVYVPGWTTIGPSGQEMMGNQVVGVTTPSSPPDVESANFLDPVTGNAAEAPLFPFGTQQQCGTGGTIACEFNSRSSGNWTALMASVTQPIPRYRPGALHFRINAVPRPDLLNRKIGVAEAANDGTFTGHVFIKTIAASEHAEIFYYKFNRGLGGFAINYAGFPGTPALAAVRTAGTSGWAPSKYGSSLRGRDTTATWCDTGWTGSAYGEFTIAWCMKQRTDPSTTQPRFCGYGDFYCDMTADGKMRCESWAGTGVSVTPVTGVTDVRALSQNDWVHVALTITATTGEAIWYVNGVEDVRRTVTSIPWIESTGSNFLIGRHTQPLEGSTHDIDEFRFRNEALDAATVLQWASQSLAAATSYGVACDLNLRHDGTPSSGSTTYELWTEGPSSRPYVLMLGLGLSQPIDLGLVFPNLPGCLLYSEGIITVGATTDSRGLGARTVRLTRVPAGTTMVSQSVLLDQSAELLLSNAHASSVQ